MGVYDCTMQMADVVWLCGGQAVGSMSYCDIGRVAAVGWRWTWWLQKRWWVYEYVDCRGAD